jgi:hypothetical protein
MPEAVRFLSPNHLAQPPGEATTSCGLDSRCIVVVVVLVLIWLLVLLQLGFFRHTQNSTCEQRPQLTTCWRRVLEGRRVAVQEVRDSRCRSAFRCTQGNLGRLGEDKPPMERALQRRGRVRGAVSRTGAETDKEAPRLALPQEHHVADP